MRSRILLGSDPGALVILQVFFPSNYRDYPGTIGSSFFETFLIQVAVDPIALIAPYVSSSIDLSGAVLGSIPNYTLPSGDVLSDATLSALDTVASSDQFAATLPYDSYTFSDFEESSEEIEMEVYGSPYVQVDEYSGPYIDNGALCIDPVEGFITPTYTISSCLVPSSMQPALEALLSLDYGDDGSLLLDSIISIDDLACQPKPVANVSTDRAGDITRAFLIKFDATNGQRVPCPSAYRLVAIAPRCQSPEFWCPNLLTPRCSQYRSCVLSSSTFDPSSIIAADNFIRPGLTSSAAVTKIPPTLTLLGSGTLPLFMTIGLGSNSWTGLVIIDYVTWGSNWTDPGALAFGTPFGTRLNLTSQIIVSGALSVDTSIATPSPSPLSPPGFVVIYSVTDVVGNTASARRHICIICPSSERICVDPATNITLCTTSGACIRIRTALTVTSQGSLPPVLTLLGPQTVYIDSSTAYDFCTPSTNTRVLCDNGATAIDDQDGKLDSAIRVCGVPTYSVASPASLPSVTTACRLGARPFTPGIYPINFTVTDSDLQTSFAIRMLIVRASCPGGEQLCPDQISCSTKGSCTTASTPSPAPILPSITLVPLPSPMTTDLVQVKRGGSYSWCNGREPTAEAPCEPGATAIDLNLPGGQKDITGTLAVCPRPDCLSGNGCPQSVMQLYALNISGVFNCDIDTLAPVGSIFIVSFWAVSSSQPLTMVSANRTVQISEPCTSDQPYFCQNSVTLDFFCAPLACATSKSLSRTIANVPLVTLTPLGTATVFVEFGTILPFALAPCLSGVVNNTLLNTSFATCGAIALDQFPNRTVIADLTPAIQVLSSVYCDDQSQCWVCTLDTIVLSGGCSPGVYSYSYQASNQDGSLSAAAVRTVVVYNASTTDLPGVVVFSAIQNSTIASLTANILNVNGTKTSNYTDAIKSILVSISYLGVKAGDIDILNSTCTSTFRLLVTSKGNSTVHDVSCNIRVWDFYPSVVNRTALSTFAATLTAWSNGKAASSPAPSSGRRRGLVELHAELEGLHRTERHSLTLEYLVSLQRLSDLQELEDNEDSIHREQSELSLKILSLGWFPAEFDFEWRGELFKTHIGPSSQGRRSLAKNISAALRNATNATSASYVTKTLATANQTLLTLLSINGIASSMVNRTAEMQSSLLSASAGVNKSIANIGTLESNLQSQRAARISQMQSRLASSVANQTSKIQVVSDMLMKTLSALLVVAQKSEVALNAVSSASSVVSANAVQGSLAADYANAIAYGISTVNTTCFKLSASYTVSFSIWNFNGTRSSVTNATGRRILAVGKGSSSGSNSGFSVSSLVSWKGYFLSTLNQTQDYLRTSTSTSGTRPRYLDDAGANKLIGGLLLHTTRNTKGDYCSDSKFSRLAVCTNLSSFLDLGSSSVAAYLAKLFAGSSNSLTPYGTDAAFLASSPLYNKNAFDNMAAYYNTSNNNLADLNVNGLPYGFHSRSLEGYEDGFPIMFENKLDAKASERLLQYIYDGVYLDKNTKDLNMELLAYNPSLHVLSYLRATFKWQLDGSIKAKFEKFGLPALDYLTSSDTWKQAFSKVLLQDLWPLWLLCLFFLFFALGEFVLAIKELGRGYVAGEKFSYKRAFTLLTYHCAMEKFDLVLALLMVAGMGVYSAYMAKYATQFNAKDDYKIYDASANAAANFLLPPRIDVLSLRSRGAINSTANLSSTLLSSLGISAPWSATDAGRYLLPQAPDELDDFAAQMAIVHSLSS